MLRTVLSALRIVALLNFVAVLTWAQSSHKVQRFVVNGHSGEATIYQIDGKSFIEVESLVRIANGSMSFNDGNIVLTFPVAEATQAPASSDRSASMTGLTQDFMSAAVKELAALKEWTNVLAYAVQKGVPGDGSRIVVLRDRANEALKQAQIATQSDSDRNALQLVTNDFNFVSGWSDKLVGERRSMSTGKYSMTENALDRDESYQKIISCSRFLATMIPGGQFQDSQSCH